MIITKTYQFKLDPTKDQSALLHKHGGNVRFVWNKLVEKFKNSDNQKLNQSICQKYILEIKGQNPFLWESYSQPLQINAKRMAETIQKAFKPDKVSARNKKIAIAKSEKDKEKQEKKLNKALQYAMPKFKSKHDNLDSIYYPQNFTIKRSRILFPKIGWINFIKHRKIEGKAKTVSVNQDGEHWFAAITCEIKIKDKPMKSLDQASIVGIDVGLKTFATLSDGTEIQNPRTLKKFQKKLKREQKKLSRKLLEETDKKTFYGKPIKHSSKRRDKQIVKVQNVYRKCRNIRKDFLHQTTHHLISNYDGVILETLDVKQMLQSNSKAMNRSICDVSWFAFGEMLRYKSQWNFKYFTKIDKFDPSSQTCNQCKEKMKLSLKDRAYLCPKCGYICGRDKNAALNIKDSGMEILRKEYKNTAGTAGIQARGSTPLGVGEKREKRQDKTLATASEPLGSLCL